MQNYYDMKLKNLLSLIALILAGCAVASAITPRYVGGDVSLLPDYEAAKSKYLDQNGKSISDLLQFCYDEGMNCMRVRLFVNPSDYTGPDKDANAKQSLEYITPLCKRIKDDGFALMLDFHYSDTWADPAKQWTPKAWEGLSDMELYQKIYDYTRETLQTLKAAGATPDFIQPGNEISYGMLWGPYGSSSLKKVHVNSDANWTRFFTLLRKAVQACREECPNAGIIIHTERVAQTWYLSGFYEKLKDYKLDYDIIGLSYYPYFHGDMSVLDAALTTLETEFPDKEIMIVETGYPLKWEVGGTIYHDIYPLTEAGQNQFAKELVDTLLAHPTVNGLFWWWFEYNAYGTSLQNWYNAPLFNSQTGRVTQAFSTICSFGTGHEDNSTTSVEALPLEHPANTVWYDLSGRPLLSPSAPGIYIRNGKKVVVN